MILFKKTFTKAVNMLEWKYVGVVRFKHKKYIPNRALVKVSTVKSTNLVTIQRI